MPIQGQTLHPQKEQLHQAVTKGDKDHLIADQ
jgi:hypothetical protein